MGQQQLLLLVLGIVVVGLAVVVGIQAFSENRQEARYDRQLQAVTEVAVGINVWNSTPSTLGGRQGTTLDLSFAAMGFPHVPTDEKILYREGTGCLWVFSAGSTYDAVRVYDVNACPASRNSLNDDDISFIVRVYPDHWRFYHMHSTGDWVRVEW